MGTDKSTDASKYFLAILKKADKGCNRLLKLFQDRYQGLDFRIKTFVLVPSKYVATDVQDLKTVTICETEIPFLCLHQQQFVDAFSEDIRDLHTFNSI